MHLDDEPFDLSDGLTDFRTALTQSVETTRGFLLTTPQFARLQQIPDRAGKSPESGGGGPGGRSRMSDLSSQQKDAVGSAVRGWRTNGLSDDTVLTSFRTAGCPHIRRGVPRKRKRRVGVGLSGAGTKGHVLLRGQDDAR